MPALLGFFLVLPFSVGPISRAADAKDGAHAPDAQDRTRAADAQDAAGAADAQHGSRARDAQDGARAEYAPHAPEAQYAVWALRTHQAYSGLADLTPPRWFTVRLLAQHASLDRRQRRQFIIEPQERSVRTASFTAGTTSPAKISTWRS